MLISQSTQLKQRKSSQEVGIEVKHYQHRLKYSLSEAPLREKFFNNMMLLKELQGHLQEKW